MLDRLSRGPKLTGDLSRVSAGLARGTSRKKWLTAAAWSNTWPAPGSSLDLDFVNDRGWVRGVGQGRSMDAVTFTRASSGTFVGPDGLLKTAYFGAEPSQYSFTSGSANSVNIIPNSEDFSQNTWTKSGLSVTLANVDTPTTVTSAYRITESSGSITFSSLGSPGPWFINVNNTFSVYAKEDPSSAKRYLVLGLHNGSNRWAWAIYDVLGGIIVTRSDGIQNAVTGIGILPADNGWYRVYVNFNSPLAGQVVSIGLTNTLGVPNSYTLGGYTGDGSSGMFIAGAQNEIAGAIRFVPRFDWASTTQVQSINLALLSNSFNNVGWFKNTASVSPVTVEGGYSDPFGGTTAYLVKEGSGTPNTYLSNDGLQAHVIYGPQTIPAFTTGFYSVFVKSHTRSQVAIGAQWNGGANNGFVSVIDLVTKQQVNYISRGGNVSGSLISVEDYPSGWLRITVSVTSSGSSSGLFVGPANNNLANYSGDGSSGVLIYGVQFNTGPTLLDYIETGNVLPVTTPLAANPACNGLLVEEARTNRLLWCRDATSGTGTNMLIASESAILWNPSNADVGTYGASSSVTGWVNAGWDTFSSTAGSFSATKSVASGVDISYSTNTFPITLGKLYEITVSVSSATVASYGVNLTATTNGRSTTSSFSGTGVKRAVVLANVATGNFSVGVSASVVGSLTVDSVSIRETTSDNVLAPDATLTAATLTATGALATVTQSVPINASTYTFSVWLRRKTGVGDIALSCNPDTGWVTQTITGSWARYSVTQTVAGTGASPGIRISTNGDQVEVWGPQLTPGSILTDYQPTVLTALYGWSKSLMTVAKDQTGVDGVTNAATSLTAAANNAVIIQPVLLTSGSRTSSVYLKRVSGTGLVQVSVDGTTWSTVDLSTTDWRRIVLTGTVTNPVVGIRLTTSGDVVAMDFAQLEDNAGTLPSQMAATSPILTTTAAVTRAGDSATISGPIFRDSLQLEFANQGAIAAAFVPITLNNTSGAVVGILPVNPNVGSLLLNAGTSNVAGFAYSPAFGVVVAGGAGLSAALFDSQNAVRRPWNFVASWSSQRVSWAGNGNLGFPGNGNGQTVGDAGGTKLINLSFGAAVAADRIQSKYLCRLILWPKPLPDEALRTLSRQGNL